ncbi:hypothetical protein M422DRAFT_51921 [Sphaerobolus stellatus SS14]|uniref:Uncharacterized protein n=1 Tax=Sphaerobolus stellatus (strain SS14) TaxID=990650 RepID=A0A0C9TWC8_SPHS4|nr:hypothetical protein M422DRAFT_51921 [Sphaerobolus stellatus SS14]
MNVYLCIRILLHSLLFITNLLALTAAAWSIHSAKKVGEKGSRIIAEPLFSVSPGAVLVLLGGIAYGFVETMLWVSACMSHPRWSRMRAELFLLVGLGGFQTSASRRYCDYGKSCTIRVQGSDFLCIRPYSLLAGCLHE